MQTCVIGIAVAVPVGATVLIILAVFLLRSKLRKTKVEYLSSQLSKQSSKYQQTGTKDSIQQIMQGNAFPSSFFASLLFSLSFPYYFYHPFIEMIWYLLYLFSSNSQAEGFRSSRDRHERDATLQRERE